MGFNCEFAEILQEKLAEPGAKRVAAEPVSSSAPYEFHHQPFISAPPGRGITVSGDILGYIFLVQQLGHGLNEVLICTVYCQAD